VVGASATDTQGHGAGEERVLVCVYLGQSIALLLLAVTDHVGLTLTVLFVWRVLDRARWAPYSV
jgi:hypothetical protein